MIIIFYDREDSEILREHREPGQLGAIPVNAWYVAALPEENDARYKPPTESP